jgi:hypothetical protein
VPQPPNPNGVHVFSSNDERDEGIDTMKIAKLLEIDHSV